MTPGCVGGDDAADHGGRRRAALLAGRPRGSASRSCGTAIKRPPEVLGVGQQQALRLG